MSQSLPHEGCTSRCPRVYPRGVHYGVRVSEFTTRSVLHELLQCSPQRGALQSVPEFTPEWCTPGCPRVNPLRVALQGV